MFFCFWRDGHRVQSLQSQTLLLLVSPSVHLLLLWKWMSFFPPVNSVFSLPLISSILPVMCWVWFSLSVSYPRFIWLFLIDYSFLLKFTDLKMIGKTCFEKIPERLWSSVHVFSLSNCSSLNPACVVPASAFPSGFAYSLSTSCSCFQLFHHGQSRTVTAVVTQAYMHDPHEWFLHWFFCAKSLILEKTMSSLWF